VRLGEIGRRQCLSIQDLGTEFRQLKTKVMEVSKFGAKEHTETILWGQDSVLTRSGPL